jgi:molybdopterin-synthase adenylyltransferase
MRYPPLGEEGQRRLSQARALVCGCGALGSLLAGMLVRAGTGHVRIVDRDFVELGNLHRQSLFDEDDVTAALPKAVAAAVKLRRINSEVEIEDIVADIEPANIEQFCAGADVIVDGTDNFETRFLMNDAAVRLGIPWVYGGCVGAEGQTMTILPGATGCLRCLLPECPPPGSTPTCDTAGILGPVAGAIASLEALEALKILSGNRQAVSPCLTVVDLWHNHIRQIDVSALAKRADCPTCSGREFPWLSGRYYSRAAVLCGRNSVQLSPAAGGQMGTGSERSEVPVPFCPDPASLEELSRRLAGVGRVVCNQFLLRLSVDGYEITVFRDGRAIVQGTADPAVARTVYARYIGS